MPSSRLRSPLSTFLVALLVGPLLAACGSSEGEEGRRPALTTEATPDPPEEPGGGPASPGEAPAQGAPGQGAPGEGPSAPEASGEQAGEPPPLVASGGEAEGPWEHDSLEGGPIHLRDATLRRRLFEILAERIRDFDYLGPSERSDDAFARCELVASTETLQSGYCMSQYVEEEEMIVTSRGEPFHYAVESGELRSFGLQDNLLLGDALAAVVADLCGSECAPEEGSDPDLLEAFEDDPTSFYRFVAAPRGLRIVSEVEGVELLGEDKLLPWARLRDLVHPGSPIARLLHLPAGSAPAYQPSPGNTRSAVVRSLAELLHEAADRPSGARRPLRWARARSPLTLRDLHDATSDPLMELPEGALVLLPHSAGEVDAELGPSGPRGQWVGAAPVAARGGFLATRLLSPHEGCVPSPEAFLGSLPAAQRAEGRAWLLRARVRARRRGAMEEVAVFATSAGGRTYAELVGVDAECHLGARWMRIEEEGALRGLRLGAVAERGPTAVALITYHQGYQRYSLYPPAPAEPSPAPIPRGWTRRVWVGQGYAMDGAAELTLPAPAETGAANGAEAGFGVLALRGAGFDPIRVAWSEGRFVERPAIH